VRLVDVYLACYFVLTAAAFASLYRSGVLARIPTGWSLTAALVVVALGVLLRVLSRRTD
jgi:hypothetical protein